MAMVQGQMPGFAVWIWESGRQAWKMKADLGPFNSPDPPVQ